MDIIIKDSNAAKSILEKNTVKWRFFLKRRILIILFLILVGLLPILPGLLYNYNYNELKQYFPNVKMTPPTHPANTMGFPMLLLVLFLVGDLIKQKMDYFRKINELIERETQTTNEIRIEINDDRIIYQSFLFKNEMKWISFSKYKLHKNFLFIYFYNDSLFSSVSIDRRLIKENEFQELLAFIIKRLPERNHFV